MGDFLNFLSRFDWIIYVVIFAVSVPFMYSCWMFWRQEVYKHSRKLLPWKYLEIKIPREILKGPKAMEQFFAALWPLRNAPSGPYKKYWEGEIPRWHVIDIIGKNKEVRFFVRVSFAISTALQGFLYAQYPDVEIFEVEDPLPKEFPATYRELEDQGYEIFGNELYQTQSPAISIRTFSEFEQESGDEKGRIIDPFAVLLELISNLKPSEMLLIQYVLMPDDQKHGRNNWRDEAKKILETLQNTTQQLGHDKEGNPQYRFRFRTPGEEGVIKRIEEKLERPTFETTLRYMYIAPKAEYNYNVGYRGIQTFFNQFQHDRQKLHRNLAIMTKSEWYYFPFIFPDTHLYWKRYAFYDEYMQRFLPLDLFAGKLYHSYFWAWCFGHRPMPLSSQELATLFHIPTNVVLTSPMFERVESKRLPSPSNLPG